MTTTESKLYSITEVAEKLEVSRRKILRLVQMDRLEAQRIGWVYYLKESQVPELKKLLKLEESN